MATEIAYDFDQVIDALNGTIELVMALWPSQPRSSSFDLLRVELSRDVADQFRRSGQRYIRHLRGNELIPFDPGYTSDTNATMRLPVAEFDDPDLIDRLLNPSALPLFDFDQAEGVAFHCFVVGATTSPTAFLRKASSVLVTARGLITTLFQDGRVDRIDQPMLAFSPAVDMLIDRDNLWVTNQATFRSLFRSTNTLVRSVSENIQSICQHVPIANLDAFESACQKDPRMMAKLARVAGKPYLSQVTTAIIRDLIEAYELPGDVIDDEGRFVHENSPQRRWLILRILDDSYLESHMTKGLYEVNSKRQV